MSTRDREEVHWRELRRQLVQTWNRDGIEDADTGEDIDLQARIRIHATREENDKKSSRTDNR